MPEELDIEQETGMRIEITVDLSRMYDELYSTVANRIKLLIKDDIQRQLKRLPEYKVHIKEMTNKTMEKILEKDL
jgi:hypothetical protein